MDIDVSFEFTEDIPGYWEKFFQNNGRTGTSGADPDGCSQTLRRYHQILWSRQLPNGQYMELSAGQKSDYLCWNDFRFGSDSITTSFRYKRFQGMINAVADSMDDYQRFMENFIRKSYTIGGMIIFPKRRCGINPSRGCSHQIKDRWDLTLECIRRYYSGEKNPLDEVMQKDKAFFDLFVDFKGYVDFFFLQDCVSADYGSIDFWLGDGDFSKSPLPQTVPEYLQWIDKQLEFIEKRNQRIDTFIKSDTPIACKPVAIMLE